MTAFTEYELTAKRCVECNAPATVFGYWCTGCAQSIPQWKYDSFLKRHNLL